MLELGSKFLISYFIGSLMGAMIVGKLRGGVDIRTMGSGNAGGTNALRTQGIWFALGVVVIDIGKGFVGAGIVPGLEIPFVPRDPEISRTWLTLCCGTAAVFGHVWPIYHRFRGGKGAATLVGTLIAVLIVGLLLRAFRQPQLVGYIITGFVMMTESMDDDEARVIVRFNNFETPVRLRFDLVRRGGNWLIDDIESPEYSLRELVRPCLD